MASRLSSLLVRDGLVGVKRMEKAFQRQVIYGGSLDTILLEMNLVPEDRLSQYLALASGLPPATRAETNVFDAEAVKRCAEEVSLRFRVVPLALADGALRVLVYDPVDMGLLEDLADVLDLPVQPLIVPEYRWHMVYTRAYGGTLPARFATLAKQADAAPVTAPVGRARTVIIDGGNADAGVDHEVVDVPPDIAPAAAAVPAAPPRDPVLRPVGPEARTMRFEAVRDPDTSAAPGPGPAQAVPELRIPADEITPTQVPLPRTRTRELSTPALVLHQEETEEQRREAEEQRRPTDTMPAVTGVDEGAVPEIIDAEAARRAEASTGRQRRTLPGVPVPKVTSPSGRIPVPSVFDTAPGSGRIPVRAAETSAAARSTPHAFETARSDDASGRVVARADTADTGPSRSGPIPTVSGPDASGRVRRAETSPGIPEGTGPITAVAAREALANADERDQIFTLLLRAIRSRARWAGLLTVQGGAAIGRLALAEPGLDTEDIASVLLPLDARSAFRTAIIERRHVVGPVATDDDDIDSMIARMGGAVPPSALLLPIVLRDRVVALAVGHRVDRPLGLGEVAELLPLAQVAADAVGRLIVRHKSLGYRAPTANPTPAITPDELPTKRAERTAGGWSVPRAATVPDVDHPTEVEMNAEPPRPVAEVLDDVDGPEGPRADDALEEAVARAAEVLPLLGARFPGQLRVDRYQVSGRALRAAQYGGLLGLIVRIGPPTADLLVEKMGDSHRDIRFYAAVCATETRPRNALYALVERLFDGDYGVRAVAIEALSGYPARDLDLAMVRARHALHSEDPDRVQAAAAAVAALADIHALPDLLDTVGRDDRRSDYARRALVALTKQDFGLSERKWRRWWEDNRLRHRLEWLIDSLGHREAALRQSAIDDLRRLTGDDLGYHPEMPRRERDAAVTRWRSWWTEAGRRRFAIADERHRPTAVLPQRRGE
jgi:hypothetical protein